MKRWHVLPRIVAVLTLIPALGAPLQPLAIETQQAKGALPRIGYLSGASDSRREDAFRQRLRELGYVDGKNVVITYRFADGKYEQLPRLAAELVGLDPAVIVVATTPATRALQRITQTIPIVVTLGEAAEGTVASYAHPGGNITGFMTINTTLTGKRLELLKDAVPGLSRVAVLYNPGNPLSGKQVAAVQQAGRTLGLQLQLIEVTQARDLDAAFEAAARSGATALMPLPDQLFGGPQRGRFGELALKHRLPTIYWFADIGHSGNLLGYGPDEREMHRRGAAYVDKILRGARPADLPIEQPAKFELAIDLGTAKALGITIPQSLRLRADTLIE